MATCPCGNAERAKGSAYCRPCANARQNAYRAEKAIKAIKAKPPTMTKAEKQKEWRVRTGYKVPKREKESLNPFNVFEVANQPIYQKWGNV